MKFFFSLPKTIVIQFIVAAVVFLSGAIGMGLVSAWVAHDKIFKMSFIEWTFITAMEEALEMSGVLIFVHALMRYYREILPGRA